MIHGFEVQQKAKYYPVILRSQVAAVPIKSNDIIQIWI